MQRAVIKIRNNKIYLDPAIDESYEITRVYDTDMKEINKKFTESEMKDLERCVEKHIDYMGEK